MKNRLFKYSYEQDGSRVTFQFKGTCAAKANSKSIQYLAKITNNGTKQGKLIKASIA